MEINEIYFGIDTNILWIVTVSLILEYKSDSRTEINVVFTPLAANFFAKSKASFGPEPLRFKAHIKTCLFIDESYFPFYYSWHF